MKFDWIVMFILFGILQSFFVMYLFAKKDKGRKHQYFVVTICIILVMQLESFFTRSGIIQYIPHFFKISTPFIFLLGPLLYLYVLSQLPQKTIKRKLYHFLVFVSYFGYSFYFYLQSSSFKINVIAKSFHPDWELVPFVQKFTTDPLNIQGYVVVEFMTLHVLIYCVISYILLKKYQSSFERDKRCWLFYITSILTLTGLVLFFSQGGVINGQVFLKTPFPHYSADLFGTVAMYFIMGYVIFSSAFFHTKSAKYSKSSISNDFKKEKLHKIKEAFEKDGLFMLPDFSMKMLSEKSELSTHHISQIINEELNSTFFQLTNHYRIEEAKKRLKSDEYIKIEQLAYDLGYKSKSTFFTAFKKETNQTPSEYKQG